MSGDIVCYAGEGMLQKGIGKESIEIRIVKEAGKIIGVSRQDFGYAYTDLLSKKLTDVLDDESHPLHERLSNQLSSRSGRMRVPAAATNRYLSSFVPQAIRIHNSNYQRGDFPPGDFLSQK